MSIKLILKNIKQDVEEYKDYMIDFKEIVYERPDMKHIESEFEKIQEHMPNAENVEQQLIYFQHIESIYSQYLTANTLAYIRHSIDTTDEYYDQENNFFDENNPTFQTWLNDFYQLLLKSEFRPELEEKLGKHFFDLLEVEAKTFSPEIVSDLIEENKLTTEYSKLVATAEVEFQGEKYTLAQLTAFRESTDRKVRKAASEAYFGYYAEHESELDRIYDELVKVRTQIAKKLGYENFVELGYYRMSRTDYDAKDVKAFRDQVCEEIVPIATLLKERQRERLGLAEIKYYDENFNFNSGNPKPLGDADWIVDNAKTMYEELSPETGEFFNFMLDYNLMDLLAKKSKEAGGYCAHLFDYKAPFIFANFNGTQGDIEVMTHEAGHAFQGYESKDIIPILYSSPTLEVAEIHSMSMEFFTWPWMDKFFGDQTEKFKFAHLAGTIEFIPYGVAVDEFQHYVYSNPTASPEERKTKWRQIEKKYQPYLDFEDNDYLERGGKWTRQLHIFTSPFYYIDYTLAQVCAFQFWLKDQVNHESAWQDYLELCRAGGSKPFTELLTIANLENPFEEGTIASVVPQIEEYLASVDDTKL